jgi:hypothetical protein
VGLRASDYLLWKPEYGRWLTERTVPTGVTVQSGDGTVCVKGGLLKGMLSIVMLK